jgi:hypothetical protein
MEWRSQHMQPELSTAEREFRDRFVAEYLLDYSAVEACYRMGFAKEYATEYSHMYMNDAYVQREIKRLEVIQNVEGPESDEAFRRRIKASLFREAHNQFSKPSSRVAALRALADLYGMNAPIKQEIKTTVESNVKFYLPDNKRDRIPGATEATPVVTPQVAEDAVLTAVGAAASIVFPAREDNPQ